MTYPQSYSSTCWTHCQSFREKFETSFLRGGYWMPINQLRTPKIMGSDQNWMVTDREGWGSNKSNLYTCIHIYHVRINYRNLRDSSSKFILWRVCKFRITVSILLFRKHANLFLVNFLFYNHWRHCWFSGISRGYKIGALSGKG